MPMAYRPNETSRAHLEKASAQVMRVPAPVSDYLSRGKRANREQWSGGVLETGLCFFASDFGLRSSDFPRRGMVGAEGFEPPTYSV